MCRFGELSCPPEEKELLLSMSASTIDRGSSIRRIYTLGSVQCWTLSCLADSSVQNMPYMRFLFVGPRVCLRLPSDPTSRWTPLPSADSSHCKACNGLSPSSLRTCRAHPRRSHYLHLHVIVSLKSLSYFEISHQLCVELMAY